MDYYETIAKIDQDIKDREELDNYIENVLDGTFHTMESGDYPYPYLKVKTEDFSKTFNLKGKTIESLKKEIREALNTKIKFYQNILDEI